MVSLAPGMTAPEDSLTVPCTVAPPALWARAEAVMKKSSPAVLRRSCDNPEDPEEDYHTWGCGFAWN